MAHHHVFGRSYTRQRVSSKERPQWSFQELGCHALMHEEAWFPCMITYSSRIKELSGGMSQAFRRIIKLFFNTDGHNMSTGGIRLPFGQRLRADFELMLQDGDAHVQV